MKSEKFAVIKRILAILTLVIFSWYLPQTAISQTVIPAFPGAEGFGANATGGRGGRVIKVTTLNADGQGSLKAAIEASGPRIIVFDVGGTIDWSSLGRCVDIRNPHLTIAGQTAPGDGILIKGCVRLQTHNVILRGLRIRVGDFPGAPSAEDRDVMKLSTTSHNADIYNIIVDHCSFSWSLDEIVSQWLGNNRDYSIRDITFQWNIISEGLHCNAHTMDGSYECHSKGYIVGDSVKRISIHHNLFAHNVDRNPYIQGNTVTEIINNVIYNWPANGTRLTGKTSKIDPETGWQIREPMFSKIVGNYYRSGPDTTREKGISLREQVSGAEIYISDNLVDKKDGSILTGLDVIIDQDLSDWGTYVKREPSGQISPLVPVSIQPVREAYDKVLSYSGARTPHWDPVDMYVLGTVQNRTGTIIDCIENCDASRSVWPNEKIDPSPIGYPDMQNGIPLLDSDNDGMPDRWETARGLNPNNSADGSLTAPSGYTWVEVHINSLISSSGDRFDTPPNPPKNLRVTQ